MTTPVQPQQTFAITGAGTPGSARQLATLGALISRYSLVLILLWIGIQKFTAAEAEGIKPLIMHSLFPVMDVLVPECSGSF